jgi:RNA polymerase primary sigma factor
MTDRAMPGPELTRFEDRLEAALDEGRRRGQLPAGAYEALLVDPDFEDAAFERFRVASERAGIRLPEEDLASDPVEIAPAPRGEPDRDLVELYLREIGRIPLIAHEELLVLARRVRRGDEEARKRMILANLRLVVHIARSYRGRGLPLLDLIEEGNLGLIHAVDRFDPERGLHLSTYAAIWIRQSMLRGIAEQSRSLRIPVQMFQQVNRFVRAERALRAALGRDPSPEEVGQALTISAERARRLAGLIGGLRSLDEGSSLAAFEQLSTEHLADAPHTVEHLVELQLEHEKVDRLLRSLSQREEQILRIRYGFLDGAARTLAQTGRHFGISRERVRQIEARALAKLRAALDLEERDEASGAVIQ